MLSVPPSHFCGHLSPWNLNFSYPTMPPGPQPGSAHVFDLVPSCEEAQANRAGRVLDLGLRLVTGGRTFAKDERTRADLSSDLVDAGFDSVTTHDPSGDLDRWNLPHTRVPTKQLVFHASGGGAGAPTS